MPSGGEGALGAEGPSGMRKVMRLQISDCILLYYTVKYMYSTELLYF